MPAQVNTIPPFLSPIEQIHSFRNTYSRNHPPQFPAPRTRLSKQNTLALRKVPNRLQADHENPPPQTRHSCDNTNRSSFLLAQPLIYLKAQPPSAKTSKFIFKITNTFLYIMKKLNRQFLKAFQIPIIIAKILLTRREYLILMA